MIKCWTIYTIRDTSGCVRYVGRTTRSLQDRLASHKNSKCRVGAWIRCELDENRSVSISPERRFRTADYELDENGKVREGWVQEIYSRSAAEECEKEYIRGYERLNGEKLLNVQFRTQGKSKNQRLLQVADINALDGGQS